MRPKNTIKGTPMTRCSKSAKTSHGKKKNDFLNAAPVRSIKYSGTLIHPIQKENIARHGALSSISSKSWKMASLETKVNV